jgi:hypothetical protein
MCSCNSKGAKAGGTGQKYLHSYSVDGKTVTKTYSSEMDARMAASSLGGTVKAA